MQEKREEDINDDIHNMVEQVLTDHEDKGSDKKLIPRANSAPPPEFGPRFQSPYMSTKKGVEPENNNFFQNRMSDPSLQQKLVHNVDEDLTIDMAFDSSYNFSQPPKKFVLQNAFEELGIYNGPEYPANETNGQQRVAPFNPSNITNRIRSNSNNFNIPQSRMIGGSSMQQDGPALYNNGDQINYYQGSNGFHSQLPPPNLLRHSSHNSQFQPNQQQQQSNEFNPYYMKHPLQQPVIPSMNPQPLNFNETMPFSIPPPHFIQNANKKKTPAFPPPLGRAHSYSQDSYSLGYGNYVGKHFGANYNGMMFNHSQGYHQNNFYPSMNNGYYGNGNNPNPNFNSSAKNTKKEKMELSALLANLYENCKDQNGSRTIQHQIELATDEEREKILDSIVAKSLDLMMDVFGNYVVQKLLEKGNDKVKRSLFNKMKSNIVSLTLHTYGCRVVQKALEVLRGQPDLQEEIIEELKNNVLKCIKDQNGNHVVQKCFESVHTSQLQFIINEVITHLDTLAFHAYGCRVIQRILEFSDPEKTADIHRKLMDNIQKLCECQYGNYIMQHILEKGPDNEKHRVLETIKKNFVNLSLDKFASNVTEKSIIFSDSDFRRETLLELLKDSPSSSECGLFKMINNQYGNYVVQKLIENIDFNLIENISRKFLENPDFHNEIKKSNYGKHVLSAIEKRSEQAHR